MPPQKLDCWVSKQFFLARVGQTPTKVLHAMIIGNPTSYVLYYQQSTEQCFK